MFGKLTGIAILGCAVGLVVGCGGQTFSAGSAGTGSTGNGGSTSLTAGSGGEVSSPIGNGGAPPVQGEAGASGAAVGSAGAGPGIPCESSPECDDANPCTTDSCGPNGFCTIRPNSDPCATDDNDCTEDKCAGGICVHPATTDPCTDDGDPCTGDVCNGGFCTHPSTGQCVCNVAGDCDDSNPCTDDSCDGSGQCQYDDNTDPCADDDNECTDDVCNGGSCMHENNTVDCTDDGLECTEDICAQGVCTHPPDPANLCLPVVKIRSNVLAMDGPRSFVALDQDAYLIFGAGPDEAELFEVTTVEGTKIQLRAMSTGHFVATDVDTNDFLIATAADNQATTFDNAACGPGNEAGASCAPNCRFLQALDDDDIENFVAVEPTCPNSGPCVAQGLRARSPMCSASQYSWEAWEFIVQ